MPLRSLFSLYFLKYRILPSIAVIIVVVVVVSTCAAPLENAEDMRYFRRTRGDALLYHRFFLPQQPPSPAAAFTAIYRSISYVDWIHGGFSGGPSLAPSRCDYEFFGTIPAYRPFTRMDRARNVLATRFCLKREFHSRIRLMQDAQFLSDYLSFHGETALRKGARRLLPAAKMRSCSYIASTELKHNG